MNLVEKWLERTLERSPILIRTVTTWHKLVADVHNLGVGLRSVAHAVQSHHEALLALQANQVTIVSALRSNSLNMQMPAIDGEENDKVGKPN